MRLEFPQRAVDGVARPAGRQQLLKCGPLDAAFDRAARRFDLDGHARRGIAQVVHARGFAAAAMLAIVERHDHDLMFLEDKSGDAKRRRQAQLFDLDVQLQSGH